MIKNWKTIRYATFASADEVLAALEKAGIPTMMVESDMVDGRGWNAEAVHADMVRFIEERL
jgi:hypothetical protein